MQVAIVVGGGSAEAAVSRVSGAAVASALATLGIASKTLELDAALPAALMQSRFDVVFPIAHGIFGEDGCLQGLLEVLQLPYVGSAVAASALAMDKPMAKRLFHQAGIAVAKGVCVSPTRPADTEGLLVELGTALVVKPSGSGSALGVTRLPQATPETLRAAIAAIVSVGDDALVETLVDGREMTCSVLHPHGELPRVLAVTEILAPNHAFYTFEARYAAGASQHLCPAPLRPDEREYLGGLSLSCHAALGCRDLSRVDMMVPTDVRQAIVLEVNTLPGFTPTSLFPEAAAHAGLSFPELCAALVRSAQSRGFRQWREASPMPGA
jgi:D-alanine-D-alanine ligase